MNATINGIFHNFIFKLCTADIQVYNWFYILTLYIATLLNSFVFLVLVDSLGFSTYMMSSVSKGSFISSFPVSLPSSSSCFNALFRISYTVLKCWEQTSLPYYWSIHAYAGSTWTLDTWFFSNINILLGTSAEINLAKQQGRDSGRYAPCTVFRQKRDNLAAEDYWKIW